MFWLFDGNDWGDIGGIESGGGLCIYWYFLFGWLCWIYVGRNLGVYFYCGREIFWLLWLCKIMNVVVVDWNVGIKRKCLYIIYGKF